MICRPAKAPPLALSCPAGMGVARTEERRKARRRVVRVAKCMLSFSEVALNGLVVCVVCGIWCVWCLVYSCVVILECGFSCIWKFHKEQL